MADEAAGREKNSGNGDGQEIEMEKDQSIGVAGEEVLYFIHGYDFENGERCI